jgi:hypothetical protein
LARGGVETYSLQVGHDHARQHPPFGFGFRLRGTPEAIVYTLFVYVKPDHARGSCAGRRGRCPSCKGTGRRFWPGARLVRAAALVVWLYIRVRRADRADRNSGDS